MRLYNSGLSPNALRVRAVAGLDRGTRRGTITASS
jgi:hypothetical protein